MKRILIIEDDKSIAEIEKDYLEMSGYFVSVAHDGETGLKRIQTEKFDLVILDIMLPGRDGFSILSSLPEDKGFPIIVVSAKDEEFSKIKGLGLGADDYMTKPFSMGELVARVSRQLKNYEKFGLGGDGFLTIRDLSISETQRKVIVRGEEVSLKQKEFDLLLFLMKNPNRVYSKEQLFEKIWGMDALSDASTVTVHVARIREKIEKNVQKPEYITTVWGVGYKIKKE